MQRSLFFSVVFTGILIGSAPMGASATSGRPTARVARFSGLYRPLPPVPGAFHRSRLARYRADLLGAIPYAANGPAIYDIRRRPHSTRYLVRRGGAPAWSGYGSDGTTLSAPAGLAACEPGAFGGPYANGPGGGLAVYIPGAFGPGPRIIEIPHGSARN